MVLGTTTLNAQDKKSRGIALENIDNNVRPQDDFYRFVNGKWLQNNKIPDDETSWGSFNQLRKATNVNSLGILNSASKSNTYEKGSDQQKALDFFQSTTDFESRNKNGVKPLVKYIDKLKSVSSWPEMQSLIIETEPYGGIGFFGFGVGAGLKNSNINVGFFGPARLGLPDREQYVAHITRMFEFMGYENKEAYKKAEAVLAYETKLSEPRLTKE